ncbi:MAG TPA: hydroxymethylbilane synthase [Candidatus Binataceae bacterium]|nr:hydroxymethylbilane synthase [Candidatus Binataceae bacterium]
MPWRLRIGSRPSVLAMAQARLVEDWLKASLPALAIEIVPIRTSGDRLTSASLAEAGGKGLFVKELEQALLAGQIELAIHSMKDLPARLSAGFRIAAVPCREDPRDALVSHRGGGLGGLRQGARLGTSSARRRFEAMRVRPDLDVVPLRGNVDTRLARLEAGELDAIIIAIAGLRRLGRDGAIAPELLDEQHFVPAGGQGALAVEARDDCGIGGSEELERGVAAINDLQAAAETAAERAYLATIGASCATAVGVRAAFDSNHMKAHALLFDREGRHALEDEIEATLADYGLAAAAELGVRLGERMLARGAADLVGDGKP